MKRTALAKRYARALLELAGSTAEAQRLVDELSRLAALYAQTIELREIVANPAFAAERTEVLGTLTRELGFSDVGWRATRYLIERGRFAVLAEIVEATQRLLEEKTGRVRAEVVAPTTLPKDRLERIRAALERITGRLVVLEEKVDPALIGGVVTRVGSMVYDGSLRSQLGRFRTSSTKES